MAMRKIAAGLLLALGIAASASAQQFPTRVVRIVVPFPPGGGIDVLARALASELTTKWAQPVIVENRVGANGIIGAEAVTKSPPDGHTLLTAISQTFVANRYLFKSLPYDPERGFVPIALMVQFEQFLVAHPSLPAKDLKEFVALAQRERGKLSFGSFGGGSQPHLVFEMLNRKENLDLLHVPYKGIAPLMTAVTAGEVNLGTGSANVAGELLRAGRLRALAITGNQRSPLFPDVPTASELGYPYVRASVWFGLFAPAGTPAVVVDKIGDEVRILLKTPVFADKHVTSRGLEVVAGTSQQLAATIREETLVVGEMMRAAGIKPE